MSQGDAQAARTLLHFGRLIGNTDMHSGDLALFVQLQDVRRGRFQLASVYDMLPMRWRPDVSSGEIAAYARFGLDAAALASEAAPMALEFWRSLAELQAVSAGLRTVAAQMADAIEVEAPRGGPPG